MGKAEIQAAEDIYREGRSRAEAEMARMKDEIEAQKEDYQAIGVLKKIEYDLAHNQILKYAALHHIKSNREYRRGGLTWVQFCRAIGESDRSVDRVLSELGPICSEFSVKSAKLAEISGVAFNKLRYLGSLVSAKLAEIEDGAILYDGQRIPLTPENKDEIEAIIVTLQEEHKKLKEESEATLTAKDRVLKAKEDLLSKQERHIKKLENSAKEREMTPTEASWLKKMETLRIGFDGYMLRIDPVNMDALCNDEDPPTPRMIAAYLSALDYMKKQILAASDTAADMYSTASMSPELVWQQPKDEEPTGTEG